MREPDARAAKRDAAGTERSGPAADRLAESATELAALLERLGAEVGPALERIADGCARALEQGGKLMLAGNGGSAAQSQHLATELVCRFSTDRVPYAALALTTDTSFLTACANDYAFEHVFARQVEALGRPGDALIVLSTSGRSANVMRAIEAARGRGMVTYGLTGRKGLDVKCDESISVPHDDPARLQEAHLFLGHLLCAAIEERVGGFRAPAGADRKDDE